MKATEENVILACEKLLNEVENINEITYQRVTDEIGSKGNTQAVYRYIKAWKTEHLRILNPDASDVQPNIQEKMSSLMDALATEQEERARKLENSFNKKIKNLEESLEKAELENIELLDFKQSVNAIFNQILGDLNIATQKKAEQEKAIGTLECLNRTLEDSERQKTQEIESLKNIARDNSEKYISFVESFQTNIKELKSAHLAEMQNMENNSRIVKMRLEETETKLTQARIDNATYAEELNSYRKINDINEQHLLKAAEDINTYKSQIEELRSSESDDRRETMKGISEIAIKITEMQRQTSAIEGIARRLMQTKLFKRILNTNDK